MGQSRTGPVEDRCTLAARTGECAIAWRWHMSRLNDVSRSKIMCSTENIELSSASLRKPVKLHPAMMSQACSQGGDYKQYLDYSKYTQGHGSQGGNFKQYMQSYGGDFSKFTQGHGAQAR